MTDHGPNPYVVNIEEATLNNDNIGHRLDGNQHPADGDVGSRWGRYRS